MVLFAVINCEGKKVLERREVVREKSTVICLAYRANVKIMKRNSKARFLSSIKLLIVVNGIEIPRGDSTLLNTLAIMNGAKDLVIPFTEGLPVVKSIVKIKEPVPSPVVPRRKSFLTRISLMVLSKAERASRKRA
jgi:hypothetical protein